MAAYVELERTQMREVGNTEQAAQRDILRQPYAMGPNVEHVELKPA